MTRPLHERLKEARLAIRRTQTQLATLFKVTHATYNRWETGRVMPTRKRQAKIEKLIDMAQKYVRSEGQGT